MIRIMRECSVEGCARPHYGHGYCSKHYQVWRRARLRKPQLTMIEKFWSKVDMNGPGGCWIWTAGTDGKGYGRFYHDGKRIHAYIFAYKLLVGEIPQGLVIDHVRARGCTSTLCVNPAHLEAVTQQVNTLRGVGPSAQNKQKSHCPQGHKYSGANLYIDPSGRRHCKTCDRRRVREYRNRKLGVR